MEETMKNFSKWQRQRLEIGLGLVLIAISFVMWIFTSPAPENFPIDHAWTAKEGTVYLIGDIGAALILHVMCELVKQRLDFVRRHRSYCAEHHLVPRC